MTDDEKIKYLNELGAKYAIIGFLKGNGKFDACLCLNDDDFKNEKKKFDIMICYDLLTQLNSKQ